jgi:hypothetical protein
MSGPSIGAIPRRGITLAVGRDVLNFGWPRYIVALACWMLTGAAVFVAAAGRQVRDRRFQFRQCFRRRRCFVWFRGRVRAWSPQC